MLWLCHCGLKGFTRDCRGENAAVFKALGKVGSPVLTAQECSVAGFNDTAEPVCKLGDNTEYLSGLWALDCDDGVVDEYFGLAAVGSPDPEVPGAAICLLWSGIVGRQDLAHHVQVCLDWFAVDERVDSR